MVQSSSREELERKLEQARRLEATVSDQTTLQRLREFAEELKQKLQQYMPRRRPKFGSAQDGIRARAHELWEQHGKPTGRDEEFWLRAERELLDADGDD